MWGNWSSTIRRTRLTPSYANSANLASDSIIYDPKYTTIAQLHKVLAAHAGTILATSLPIKTRIDKASGVRYVTHNGTGDQTPVSFYFNDGKHATQVTGPDGIQYAMASSSSRVFVGSNPAWYSEPAAADGPGRPYLPAVPVGALNWSSWSDGVPTEQNSPPDAVEVSPMVGTNCSSCTFEAMCEAADTPGDCAWCPTIHKCVQKGQKCDHSPSHTATADAASGTWYRTSFARPHDLPAGAQVSINLTGGNSTHNSTHIIVQPNKSAK